MKVLAVLLLLIPAAQASEKVKDVEKPYIRDKELGKNFVGIRYEGKKAKGSFENLESTGAGEDESLTDLCYEGKEKDLCDLVEDIAKKTNKKEDRGPRSQLKVKTCKIDGHGRLDIEVSGGEKHGFSERNIEECGD